MIKEYIFSTEFFKYLLKGFKNHFFLHKFPIRGEKPKLIILMENSVKNISFKKPCPFLKNNT